MDRTALIEEVKKLHDITNWPGVPDPVATAILERVGEFDRLLAEPKPAVTPKPAPTVAKKK